MFIIFFISKESTEMTDTMQSIIREIKNNLPMTRYFRKKSWKSNSPMLYFNKIKIKEITESYFAQ